jgi:hypothetical protein
MELCERLGMTSTVSSTGRKESTFSPIIVKSGLEPFWCPEVEVAHCQFGQIISPTSVYPELYGPSNELSLRFPFDSVSLLPFKGYALLVPVPTD